MDERLAEQIAKLIKGKGWALYRRGPSGCDVSPEGLVFPGPADSLEQDIIFDLLPLVLDVKSKEAIDTFLEQHKVLPRMVVPFMGIPYLGKMVAVFSGGDEEAMLLIADEELDFIGIELQSGEVRLIRETKTFMPYNVFVEALKSLNDITTLEGSAGAASS